MRDLEPDGPALETMMRLATELIAGVEREPASAYGDGRVTRAMLRPPPDHPGDLASLLTDVKAAAAEGVDTAGPGYLAYFPAGGLMSSALGELIAQVHNRFTSVAELAPALVAMEHGVLRWLCDRFALPPGSAGLTTTGGSTATLAALVAARHDRLGDDFHEGTLYVTEHTHYCVAKAARISGLAADRVRVVPAEGLRMDPGAAAELIAADRAAGLRPFLMVGTAGTTSTGTVDPLTALAGVARDEGLWFHVDAAYGGGFQLTSRGRARLAGVEHADSLVLDPHKSLFLQYGTGVLLVRDGRTLAAAHTGFGDYLQDLQGVEGLPDFGHLGPELTHEFRGLRMWLPLHLHGVAAFRDALDEKLDLAALVHRELSADPLFDLPWEPDLTVVPFRLHSGDAAGQRLLERINATGRIFLSSTRVDGRFYLRLNPTSHRTREHHVRDALALIRALARTN
ncbi:pyridoxal phosphate-dependent decarboxylase family protein [Spirillospora sp. CA-294931]|uniref:pyridoxal phosphate-dependent decarboxylase family protein n=1 Tax=Spirillospora sp. CA-294931 TaxID=3240042 RepID=UPI003D92B28A